MYEESGIKCEVGPYLGAVSYPTQRGRLKLVKYWLMKARKGSFVANLEVDKAEWVGINGARALLTYNRDARLIERAYATLQDKTSSRLYVVRHGNAGVRSKWKGPDKKRPLTKKGEQQALITADIMARHPVSEVRSSPAIRCVQTVEPLAANLNLDVAVNKKLKETMSVDEIHNYLSQFKTGAVVLSTHKDWIGPLIGDLDNRKVQLRGARRWPKSSIWVFDLIDGEITAGYYTGRGATAAT